MAPGIFGEARADSKVDVALVWIDETGALTYVRERESRAPARLSLTALDKALSLPPKDPNAPDVRFPDLDVPRRLVVPDQATLRRLIAWVSVAAANAPAGDHTAASVLRRLQLSAGLVASTRVIVLTRALARKFWLGAQYDPEDFMAWRRSFGFGSGASTMSVISRLVALASEGRTVPKYAREAFNSESYALCSAAFAGLGSAVSAFRRAETADTAARALLTTDPLLRERGLLDGSMSSARVLEVRQGYFTATVSTPFKLRAGKQVLLIDPATTTPGDWVESQLSGVSVARIGDEDQLVARIAIPSGRTGTAATALVERARSKGAGALLITESPYLPFNDSSNRARRWTQSAGARSEADAAAARARRDVPLDVIVAGAPTA